MAMQQDGSQSNEPVQDITLSYELNVRGDASNPDFDLEGLDEKSKKHLKKEPGKDPVLEFPYGLPWYILSFKLKDKNLHLRFNDSRPVDAHDDPACPKQFSGVTTDQIKVGSVNGNSLEFTNVNQHPRDIGYGLNLVDKDGNDFPRFDPIFQNAGGGRI